MSTVACRATTTPARTSSLRRSRTASTSSNARIGIRGPDQRWAIEFWGQNIFDTNYTQVAFSTPFQAASTTPGATTGFPADVYPGGTQVFSAFLAEPRTYGITVRGRF